MLEYSADFSHLKIIGWHFEAGWRGEEGRGEGICLPKRRLEQRNRNDFQKFSFFLPFLLSLPLSRRADKRLGLMQFMVMSSRRGEPRPGGVAPSCPGTLLCSGTALLWLLVGNPEQGLPGGVAGPISGDLLFIWGQEPRQGGWQGVAASWPGPGGLRRADGNSGWGRTVPTTTHPWGWCVSWPIRADSLPST